MNLFRMFVLGLCLLGAYSASQASNPLEPAAKQIRVSAGVSESEEDPAFLMAFETLMAERGYDQPQPQAEIMDLDDLACMQAYDAAVPQIDAYYNRLETPQAVDNRMEVLDRVPSPVALRLKKSQKRDARNPVRRDLKKRLRESVEELDFVDPEPAPLPLHPVQNGARRAFNALPLAPETKRDAILMGLQIKMMANVYAGKTNEMANIFVPRYGFTYEERGEVKTLGPQYFETAKGEICVFASGGTRNHWEKSIGRVYESFFNQKVKIIRWRWMKRHVKDAGGRSPVMAFEQAQEELHSELYYALFFEHYFLPKFLKKYDRKIRQLRMDAFSWWQVCDGCEGQHVRQQKQLCASNGIQDFSFTVAAAQAYTHGYGEQIVTRLRVNSSLENQVWLQLWQNVMAHIEKPFQSAAQKAVFWAETVDGLEITKWLGQAFRKNLYMLDGSNAKHKDAGDVLAFYEKLPEPVKKKLGRHLDYLRDVNWELSCFYSVPYVDGLQGKWESHNNQVVMPHFGWELVYEGRDEDRNTSCEICGHSNLLNYYTVFHPKHRPTRKYYDLDEALRVQTENSLGFDLQTDFAKLPSHMQLKRRQSLIVGSECLELMRSGHDELEEYRSNHPDEEQTEKFNNLNLRVEQNKNLDQAQATSLYNWMKARPNQDQGVLVRQITNTGMFSTAADVHPVLKLLMEKNLVEKNGRKYRVLKPD